MIRIYILNTALGLLFCSSYSHGIESEVKDKFPILNTSLLNLYKTWTLVAVGEGQHNSSLTFEWLTSLINEVEFPDVVRNVVVEFGASEYHP